MAPMSVAHNTDIESSVGVVSSQADGSSGQVEPSTEQQASRWTPGIRLLRLPQVLDLTGLGKTTIYELQAEGKFPARVKITAHSVGWIETEVQAWLSERVLLSDRNRLDRPRSS